MSDQKEIWLQPECCANEYDGRLWSSTDAPVECDDGVPWTKYVIASEYERLRAELSEQCVLHGAGSEREAALMGERDRLRNEVEALRADAERLDWVERMFFERKWDGTIGRECDWYLVGSYRHVANRMKGNSFREAIDAARKEKP